MRSTGSARADASDDFLRARRRQGASRLARWVGRGPGDLHLILPFEEVVAALGRVGEHDLGEQVIPLDTIVGTVDRPRGFDRSFRPTSGQVRARWERIAGAMRRGDPLPAIDVYRVGEVHFVRDGHHRVSVARALGLNDINARVIEVSTRVGAEGTLRLADLPRKGHERLLRERVPLPATAWSRIDLQDPDDFGELAETVEAWGFRHCQERGDLLDREATAAAWFAEEYVPSVELLRESDLLGPRETEAEAYLRLSGMRYKLMHTHDWTEEALERLRTTGWRRRG